MNAESRRAAVREADTEPTRRNERQRFELVARVPRSPVRRTGELVFEVAADDCRPVEDANAVVVGRVVAEPYRPVHGVDGEEAADLADEAGFLLELAQRGGLGVFAELDA